MYFTLSIPKLRLDNSRLRFLVYETHDLNAKVRHHHIIVPIIQLKNFVRVFGGPAIAAQ
jgi:hypothetical protein